MADLNLCIITGNVGADPRIHYRDNGDAIANISVATNRTWKDQSGERRQQTTWHKVVVYAPALARVVAEYVKRGSRINVVGNIETRSYEKDGATVYVTELVVNRFNGQVNFEGPRHDDTPEHAASSRAANQHTTTGDPDDDIPF